MSEPFYSNFPTIQYPYQGKIVAPSGDKQFVNYIECTDLGIRYRIQQDILANPLSYYDYHWKDRDRPDSIAHKYYGDVNLAWLVMFSGELFHWLYDFPMPSDQFVDYIEDLYQADQFTLQTQTHHLEDIDGAIIDQLTFDDLAANQRSTVTVFDYEFDLNESRRKIKLLSDIYVNRIKKELRKELNTIKANRNKSNFEFIIN